MSSQPNRLRPTTTALAMLRRGWTLTTPDNKFSVEKENELILVIEDTSDAFERDFEIVGEYPLTPDGFEAMMNEVVNPPF